MSQTHYEERLEKDLTRIRDSVRDVGEQVETALQTSLHALLTVDTDLAYRTILADLPINRAVREIDRLCHQFVARHLPGAGHLRFISAVLRMDIELERIGDYAVSVCRHTVRLTQPLDPALRREAERLGRESFGMLHQTLQAFTESNADLARGTMAVAAQITQSIASVHQELIREGREGQRDIDDLFATSMVLNRLERVSEQAKNICEEIVFAVTGQTKVPKTYRVVFVDVANDVRSQMALAIARRAYPHSGEFEAGGLRPAAGLDPAFVEFMAERGFDLRGETPKAIGRTEEEWDDVHVIVSLEGPVRDYVARVPFRTVALAWQVSTPAAPGTSLEDARPAFEQSYQEIAYEVSALMETLRGEDAA